MEKTGSAIVDPANYVPILQAIQSLSHEVVLSTWWSNYPFQLPCFDKMTAEIYLSVALEPTAIPAHHLPAAVAGRRICVSWV